MLMHDLPPDDPDVVADRPLAGPNQWPADCPGFREAVTAYDTAMRALAAGLTRVIALALGLEADAMDAAFARPTTFLRLLHYPPHPTDAPARLYGSAPHTDYGFITLLAQDAPKYSNEFLNIGVGARSRSPATRTCAPSSATTATPSTTSSSPGSSARASSRSSRVA